MTLTPDNTKQQIIALLQSNQPAQARELCLEFVRNTADPHALVLLAKAQLQMGDLDAAIPPLRQAIKKGWNDAGALVMLTALLITRDKQAEADSCFARTIKRLPNVSEAHLQVARTLRQLGNHAVTVDRYRKAIELNPNNYTSCFEFAAFLQEVGQFKEAAQWYERCLAIRSDNVQAFINLAMCLGSMKKFDRAVAVLEQAVVIAPSNPVVFFQLGENYQQQNRYHLAIASYQRALEQSPEAAALYGSLARAQRSLGELDAAMANLQRAQALEPENATVYTDMGICLYRDDDLRPALRAFTEAVRLNPGNALSRFYLGLVRAQSGDQVGAEEQFGQACRIWPYMEAFLDSYHYARQAGPDARCFCTARQMFEYAVCSAGADGLFLEFGVYYGASINIIARLTGNTVHGFDTFQGLPIDWVVNNDGRREVEAAGSYSTHGSLPEAPENVQYHVGTFEDTLPNFCNAYNGPVSFMNIDCDLYESTRTVFTYLRDQIHPGAVIVFDEYFCLPGWRDHEYKAFQEFLQEKGFGYEYLAFNLFSGQAAIRISRG